MDENQFGFMAGRSTMGAIFVIQQLQEKYLEKKRKLYHIFVDLEKAFDKVPRPAIRWALRRQRGPESLIDLVMALYREMRSRVRVAVAAPELGQHLTVLRMGLECIRGQC